MARPRRRLSGAALLGAHRDRLLDASLEHSTAAMVTALFDQAEERDPERRRRWIVLVDGANHQLDCIGKEATARGVDIDVIVDFVHVLEYLWKTAEDLHPAQTACAAFTDCCCPPSAWAVPSPLWAHCSR